MPGDLDVLGQEIDALLRRLTEAEDAWRTWTDEVSPRHRRSATNLVHYWALRQEDLRGLQERLSQFGLSSLGRSEGHVQATLRLVRAAVAAMREKGWAAPASSVVDTGDGPLLLSRNATDLLGPAAEDRAARIMVTLPSEAATDRELVRQLVDAGMRIARINCAHDDPAAWQAMAANVRSSAGAAGRHCMVAMDLAGPKLRTGPLQPGPRVIRLRPMRNALGQMTTPARVWLTAPGAEAAPPPQPGMICLPVDRDWLARRRLDDQLRFRDARGARRHLLLSSAAPGGFVATAGKTIYLCTGAVLHVDGAKDPITVGELPPLDQAIPLRRGDLLRLTRDCSPAPVGVEPRIGCTLPEVFDNATIGDRIFLDDGKLSGHVVDVAADHIDARIDRPPHATVKLRAAKGINVPDTTLPISALTGKDIQDLDTVVAIADIVELSFAREPEDVLKLFAELERRGQPDIGVVLKIETQQAFMNLPRLLLTAMRRDRVGVMVARGDLAVECGYDRLAEVQEETLRLCEAAHLPIIWATQVLEQLVKTGQPSRAEISDAAMGERAECVMLNKGPCIVDAVLTLDDILGRMASLEYKSNTLLRRQTWTPAAP